MSNPWGGEKPKTRSEWEEASDRNWHSRYYHDQFADYEEVTEPGKNGKSAKIKRMYAGQYYQAQVTDRQWRLYRIVYVLLSLCSFGLFALAATRPFPVNAVRYMILPQVAALCVYLLLGWFLLGRMFAGRTLRKRSYNESSRNVRSLALVAAIALGIGACMSVIHCAVYRVPTELLEALAFGVCAGLMATVWRLESRIDYRVLSEEPEEGENHE